MLNEPMLRELRTTDLPDLIDLSTHAGWNQTPADWEVLFALSPNGCFGIEVDNHIVATTTLVCVGHTVAWVGMVLTHPSHRRQGFARRLLQHAVQQAHQFGITTLKLDATEEGRNVYEAFGFHPERKIERWLLTNQQPAAPSQPASPLDTDMLSLDEAAYQYDRSAVLHRLASRSNVFRKPDGYLLSRPGRLASYLGPYVATNRETAANLLTMAIRHGSDAGFYWDIFPDNASAIALAEAQGFERNRTLTRMSLGQEIPESTQWIYGIAGFEIG